MSRSAAKPSASAPAASVAATVAASVATSGAMTDEAKGEAALPAPYSPSEALFRSFFPEAEAIAGDVPTCTADPGIARYNVKTGADALAPHVARLSVELPGFDLAAAQQLPALADAVAFEARQVAPGGEAAPDYHAALTESRKWRKTLLQQADAHVTAEHFPADEVQRIRAGSGPADTANDCVDLAALYTRCWPVMGARTTITFEQVEQADRAGQQLKSLLTPDGAPRLPAARPVDPHARLRDRLWALLERRYLIVRVAGHLVFGENFEAHVPALRSRGQAPRAVVPADPPAAPPAAREPLPLSPAEPAAKPEAPAQLS